MRPRPLAVVVCATEEAATRKARSLSKRHGLRFKVWRGSDGTYAVTPANRRPPTVTWAEVATRG